MVYLVVCMACIVVGVNKTFKAVGLYFQQLQSRIFLLDDGNLFTNFAVLWQK